MCNHHGLVKVDAICKFLTTVESDLDFDTFLKEVLMATHFNGDHHLMMAVVTNESVRVGGDPVVTSEAITHLEEDKKLFDLSEAGDLEVALGVVIVPTVNFTALLASIFDIERFYEVCRVLCEACEISGDRTELIELIEVFEDAKEALGVDDSHELVLRTEAKIRGQGAPPLELSSDKPSGGEEVLDPGARSSAG